MGAFVYKRMTSGVADVQKFCALGGDDVTIAINYPGRIAIYVEGVGLLAALHSQ